ncbi:MAG: hypothetical protein ACHQUC_09145 [Chlamydiales bacterium]
MNREEILALFTLSDGLDECKAQHPPNQIIVQFLGELQALLFSRLKDDPELKRQV